MVNVCIIHYNTPELTSALVRSIKRTTKNVHIYIFDNSDKNPFINNFTNVTVFDNTDGEIIDFNKILSKYPNRKKSLGRFSNYGSFKHCISVNKCFDLIDDNFILLDSDVLIKKDLTDVFNDEYFCIGEDKPWSWGRDGLNDIHNRFLPFICFINVKKCKELGINFYDDRHMVGLYNTNSKADSYDTGCWFYECLIKNKCKTKEIKCDDYIVHYGGGSYRPSTGSKENITKESFLKKYSYLHTTNFMHKNKEENKKVVYTCITGNYDNILEPLVIMDDWNYICYTDNKEIQSDVWEFKQLPEEIKAFDNVRKNRYIKLFANKLFPKYDISLYVDGCVLIKDNINLFLNESLNDDDYIAIPTHPTRDCIYEEANACIKMKKDSESVINKQMKKYKEIGMPSHFGLTQNNIILRRHNNKMCIDLMKMWWDEIVNHSYRDQLSLMYSLWKNGVCKIKFLDKDTCRSKYFNWRGKHNNFKKRNTALLKTNIKNSNNNTATNANEEKKKTMVGAVKLIHKKQTKVVKKTRTFLGSGGRNW